MNAKTSNSVALSVAGVALAFATTVNAGTFGSGNASNAQVPLGIDAGQIEATFGASDFRQFDTDNTAQNSTFSAAVGDVMDKIFRTIGL